MGRLFLIEGGCPIFFVVGEQGFLKRDFYTSRITTRSLETLEVTNLINESSRRKPSWRFTAGFEFWVPPQGKIFVSMTIKMIEKTSKKDNFCFLDFFDFFSRRPKIMWNYELSWFAMRSGPDQLPKMILDDFFFHFYS